MCIFGGGGIAAADGILAATGGDALVCGILPALFAAGTLSAAGGALISGIFAALPGGSAVGGAFVGGTIPGGGPFAGGCRAGGLAKGFQRRQLS